MQIERLIPLARQLLQVTADDGTADPWLWEHSERVMRLTELVAALPELQGLGADRTALAAAALFHDAGWTLEVQQGRYKRWQILTRPTTDLQRELGAALLQEEAGHVLSGPVTRLAADAIRQSNDRNTTLLEARILAECEALDEISTIYLVRQVRQYQAEGRPLQQLISSWERQKEYRYWELRLNEGFRYEMTRELARLRLQAVDAFMAALARDLHGDDIRRLLADLGRTTPVETA